MAGKFELFKKVTANLSENEKNHLANKSGENTREAALLRARVGLVDIMSVSIG